VLPSAPEGETRSGDDVSHRACGEHLVRPRFAHDPRGKMDRESTNVVATQLDLAEMEAGTDG
jgi:hypothetical protein